jgi:hypothetical protein
MRNPSGFVKNEPSDLSDGVRKQFFRSLLEKVSDAFTKKLGLLLSDGI